MVKPFSVSELLARIEAVLRRSPDRPDDARQFSVPGGILDLGRRELRFKDGRLTPLSEREAELLAYLARHADRAVPREEILARIWKLNPDAVETRTIDMHIARLREKLGDDATKPKIILTLRGRGYQFVLSENAS
jgi:DNA-binding response OmpR family regulator